MLARYLSACLNIEFTKPKVGILGEHGEPRRFRGTKILIKSKRISPDYPFDATIHHTENNGADVWITWADINGRIHGPYQLQPDDEIEVISVRDAKSLSTTPTPPAVVKQIQEARKQDRKSSSKNPIERLSKFLTKGGVSNRLVDDRLMVAMNSHYVDFVGDNFELGSFSRGVIGIFKETKEGVQKLLKRIIKIEDSLDYEKMLERMGD